jgi:MFS transporter, DHA1 family, inner membrane transport protein
VGLAIAVTAGVLDRGTGGASRVVASSESMPRLTEVG